MLRLIQVLLLLLIYWTVKDVAADFHTIATRAQQESAATGPIDDFQPWATK